MFVSHAQNFEDVVLWRALKQVANGFYIDIGAQDPVEDSVSLAFYEKGWRGVHVEPTPAYAAKLRNARPDEEVIETAISRVGGSVTLYEISGTGLTTGKRKVAKKHEANGFVSKPINVVAMPMSELLDRYSDRETHWLKIDVEGMEADVLRGWRPAKARPWIVIVESTIPSSQKTSHASWERELLALDYKFAYFDGLNRFYVHRDRSELASVLAVPPNVFDGFVLSRHSLFSTRLNDEILGLQGELRTELDVQQVNLAEIRRLQHELTENAQAHADERGRLSERISLLEGSREAAGAEISRLQAQIALAATERRQLLEISATSARLRDQRDAEISRLQAQIAQAETERRQLLELSATSARLRDQGEAEISRLHAHIAHVDRGCARERVTAAERLSREQLRADRLETDLAAIHASTSWRVTGPFRLASRATRWFARGVWAWVSLRPSSRPHRALQRTVSEAARFARSRPRVARMVRRSRWLQRHLNEPIEQPVARATPEPGIAELPGSINPLIDDASARHRTAVPHISREARRVYRALRIARSQRDTSDAHRD